MARDLGLSIRVDAREVIHFYSNYAIKFPQEITKGMKDIARMYAKVYLKHIRLAGIRRWTGRSEAVLQRQTKEPVRLSKSSWGVEVPNNLLALDRFKKQPHKVKLRKNSSIGRWAKTVLGIEPRGQLFLVKRHPWIDNADSEATTNIRVILEKRIRRAISRSKLRG